MRWSLRAAIALASLAVLYPLSAGAQAPPATWPEPTDEQLIARGIELRKGGLDEEALSVFELADAHRPSARTAAQIALAHEALGHWLDAERGLLDVLHADGDPWVVRQREYLVDSLATVQRHLAWLEVASNVPGTELRVAGGPAVTLPLAAPLRIVSGDVNLDVRAPGAPPVRRAIRVEANAIVREEFSFVNSTVHETVPVEVAPPSRPSPSPQRSRSALRTGAWGTLAGTGALVLAGIAAASIRERDAQLYNDDGRCGPLPGGVSRYARCGAYRDTGDAAGAIAIASFASAGIAATVDGVLFSLSASPPKAAAGATSTPPVAAGFSLTCGGVF
jgi:hypothetical protein